MIPRRLIGVVAGTVLLVNCGEAMYADLPVTAATPVIDGHLTPDETALAAKVTFTVLGGLDKPKFPTTAYLTATSDSLYVGFTCEDPDPANLVLRTKKENGAAFEDDSVQLLIATVREPTHNNYIHFAVNAAGFKYSNAMSDDQPVEQWQAVTSRNAKGWEAEMLIPLGSIHGSLRDTYWRVNLARFRPKRGTEPEETSAWVNPGATLHNYRRFGFLRVRNPQTSATATGLGSAEVIGTTPSANLGMPVTTGGSASGAATVAVTPASSSGVFAVGPTSRDNATTGTLRPSAVSQITTATVPNK